MWPAQNALPPVGLSAATRRSAHRNLSEEAHCYDIPGYPTVLAGGIGRPTDETDRTVQTHVYVGWSVWRLRTNEVGEFRVSTTGDTVVFCKAVVIAAGLGCFRARKTGRQIPEVGRSEGKGVSVLILTPRKHRDPPCWYWPAAATLPSMGSSTWPTSPGNLRFRARAAKNSAERPIPFKNNLTSLSGNVVAALGGTHDKDQQTSVFETDDLIPLFGLSPKLGPIGQLGPEPRQKRHQRQHVKISKTNLPGVSPSRDINTYPGKPSSCLQPGFHEGALIGAEGLRVCCTRTRNSVLNIPP
ncbi:hypothetical protein FQR65_LT20999 [Abscondita terminalis]|nr:hypothetical protein FQR65_LT20999 [Abscondita terminalis]